MNNLGKLFKKFDRMLGKRKELLEEKKEIEKQSKDNELLARYLEIVAEISKLEKDNKDMYSELYDNMSLEQIDLLEGKNCNITLKHPYERISFNTKLFLQEHSPRTKLYKQYVTKEAVKGNIMVKEVK